MKNKKNSKYLVTSSMLLSIGATLFASIAKADPPDRVARLSYMQGNVSFSPAGGKEWVAATPNRPLTIGDQLWADKSGRAELQLGSATLHLASNSSFSILNLDNHVGQFQVSQGTFHLHVRRLGAKQVYEIDTPNLAFSIQQPGDYRLDVDTQGNATLITVRNGAGTIYGKNNISYPIASRQSCSYPGDNITQHQCSALPARDSFDRWSDARDARLAQSVSARYVAPGVIGAQDLDAHGTWRAVPNYGHVWVPAAVPAGWAPYRYGHWVWVRPWGWTWVDNQPWGFAPFHYGRWAYVGTNWAWVPGPIYVRPVYAPALVAFVNGPSFQVSFGFGGGVGWFPLGPGEAYYPGYAYSRGYFSAVNVSNTVINRTVINNYYGNQRATINYRNRLAPNAVTAVSRSTFVGSQAVTTRTMRPLSQQVLTHAQVMHAAQLTPTNSSVIGSGAPTKINPPSNVMSRQVVSRLTPAHPMAGITPAATTPATATGVHPQNIHVPGGVVPATLHPRQAVSPRPGMISQPGLAPQQSSKSIAHRAMPVQTNPAARSNVMLPHQQQGPTVVHHPLPRLINPTQRPQPAPIHRPGTVQPGANVRPNVMVHPQHERPTAHITQPMQRPAPIHRPQPMRQPREYNPAQAEHRHQHQQHQHQRTPSQQPAHRPHPADEQRRVEHRAMMNHEGRPAGEHPHHPGHEPRER